MVRGLDIFKKYFEQYSANYVIIGGTACDMIIDEAGFTPRALMKMKFNEKFVESTWFMNYAFNSHSS